MVSNRASEDNFVLCLRGIGANVTAVVSRVLEWFLMSRSV
jgi:hypothetical protein